MLDDVISIGALADVLNTIEQLPRSQRGGRWTRAVRTWRRQLLEAGATGEEAEAEIGRTFRLAWNTSPELREVMPRPENPLRKPPESFCRFTDGRKPKGPRRAQRPAVGSGGAS